MESHNVYWMNPPYSRGAIDASMAGAKLLNIMGKTVVCLVRLDPTTDWFQAYIHGDAEEVRMLNKRVRFKGAEHSYNFPCCVAVYTGRKTYKTQYKIWGWE